MANGFQDVEGRRARAVVEQPHRDDVLHESRVQALIQVAWVDDQASRTQVEVLAHHVVDGGGHLRRLWAEAPVRCGQFRHPRPGKGEVSPDRKRRVRRTKEGRRVPLQPP